jgi:hypothetical protein
MATIRIPERLFLPPSPRSPTEEDSHKRSLDHFPDDIDPSPPKRRRTDALATPEDSPAATAAGTPVPRDATGRPRIYACGHAGCGALFSRPCRREEHERRHTGARPFVCTLEAVPSPGSTSTGEAATTTTTCGKTFARADHLARHERHAHAGERPHACAAPGCGKRFATAQRLRAHEAAHRRRREFACTGAPGGGGGCGAVFRKKSTLAAHIARVHVGVKPFPCGRVDEDTGAPCKAGYNTAGKLAEHVRKRHSGARYFCTLCPAAGAGDADDDEGSEDDDGGDDDDTATASFLGFASLAALLLHKRSAHLPPPPTKKRPARRAPDPADDDDDGLLSALDPNLPGHRALHHAFRRAAEAAAEAAAAASSAAAATVPEPPQQQQQFLTCLALLCPARLPNEAALAAHCGGAHGMAPVDVAEALRERAAAEGGAFWVGGPDDGADAAIEDMLALVGGRK